MGGAVVTDATVLFGGGPEFADDDDGPATWELWPCSDVVTDATVLCGGGPELADDDDGAATWELWPCCDAVTGVCGGGASSPAEALDVGGTAAAEELVAAIALMAIWSLSLIAI